MNLKPTERLVNGKIVVFYSPQQIEEIVPVTVRLKEQKPVTGGYNMSLNGKTEPKSSHYSA